MVSNCKKDNPLKDDVLSIGKTNYTGNHVSINGYYYKKYGTPEKLTIYLFYSNGVLLHTGDGWEHNNLNNFEQMIQSADFVNKLKGIKYAWGVFNIENNVIKFERWYPSDPPLKAYVRAGEILNDTTFMITESYRMYDGKKTEVHSKNEIYHFKQFSHKPDSTNNFVEQKYNKDIQTGSVRVNGGIGYYWKNYDVTSGWQTTYGYEVGLTPFLVMGSTTYNNSGDKFDQRLWCTKIGVPGLNIKYENDMSFGLPFGDGGDRYRTAAAKIQVGPIHVGINLFTGDPGLNREDRMVNRSAGGKGGLYVKNPNTGADPDEYRAGVGYIGIGPFRFGTDTESRRHRIQNELVHDKLLHNDPSPWFKVLDKPDKFYFQFGNGGGFLW